MRLLLPLALTASVSGCVVAPAIKAPAVFREPAAPMRATAPTPHVAGQAQPPRLMSNLSSLIRAVPGYNYPVDAVSARLEGSTGVTLTVGPDGRVTGCSVTRSAGSSILDASTCRLLRSRARFTPARDAAGNPRIATYDTVIDWRLPPG